MGDLEEMTKAFGANVRAIYGCGEFLRGPMSVAGFISYGTIFSRFNEMLTALLELEFGSSGEYNK